MLDEIDRNRFLPRRGEEQADGDDRELAGLVPIEAAVVGRGRAGVLLQGLRRGDNDRGVDRGRLPGCARERLGFVVLPGAPAEILPAGFACPKCGGTEFTKETDVLDVWFDSGSSCRAVVENRLAHVSGGYVFGRLRPAPGMVQQVAGHRHGHEGRVAVQGTRQPRFHARQRGQGDEQVDRQHRRPAEDHIQVGRGRAAAVLLVDGLFRGRARRRGNTHARDRRVPAHAQHIPIRTR